MTHSCVEIFPSFTGMSNEERLQASGPLDFFNSSLQGVQKSINTTKWMDEIKKDAPHENDGVPLDVAIFGGQIVHSLRWQHLPRVLNVVPPLFDLLFNPFLHVLLLVVRKFGVLQSHDRNVEVHAVIAICICNHEWSQHVNDFLFFMTAPQILNFFA